MAERVSGEPAEGEAMTERQEAGRLTIAKHGNDYCVGADGVGLLGMQMTRSEAISYRAGWYAREREFLKTVGIEPRHATPPVIEEMPEAEGRQYILSCEIDFEARLMELRDEIEEQLAAQTKLVNRLKRQAEVRGF